MGFFKKDRRVFGITSLVRMMVAVLVVVIAGVSGTILMADWQYNTNDDPWTDTYVGIGIENPTSNLHIRDQGSASIRIDDLDDSRMGVISVDDSVMRIWSSGAGSNLGKIIFATGSGGGTDRMTLLGDGKLGLGTSNPTNNFHIKSYGSASIRLDDLDDSRMGVITVDNSVMRIWSSGAGSNLGTIIFATGSGGGTNRVEINCNDGQANFIVSGKTTSNQYTCTSDSRFKKNITLYKNALEKVLGLRGVTFFWNTEKYKDRSFGREKQIGFIAQEVEKVIPEIVYTDEKGFKMMSYDRLTAVLVEAVKELKAEKDGEIAVLKSENEDLKQRLAKYESLADRLVSIEKELGRLNDRKLAEK